MILSGNVAVIGEKRNAYMELVAEPERHKQLGRPRRRREDKFNYSLMKCDERL